jgi:hypothetical protein
MSLLRLALTATVLLGALAAAPAGAADYCVNDPACMSAGGSARPSVQVALADAAASAAADRVFVGAGVHDLGPLGSTAYAGDSALELVGRGAATVLTQTVFGQPTYPWVLTLTQRAGAVVVRDLTIRLGDGAGGRGLRLLGGASGERIRVEDPAGATGGSGISLAGGRLLDADVDLDGAGAGGLSIVTPAPAGSGPQVEGGSFRSAEGTAISVDVDPGQPVHLHGFTATGGGALSVTRGRVVVDSALLRGSGLYAVASVANTNAYTGELRAILRHVTIAGGGSAQQVGLRVRGGLAGQHATAKLLDAIVTGVGRPIERAVQNGGSADVVTERVNHGAVLRSDNPTLSGSGALTETGVTDLDPQFVAPAAGDYRLQPGSPLTDAGRAEPLDFDEPATDRAGAARIADGDGDGVARRDLGAYELPAVPLPGGGACDGATGACGGGPGGACTEPAGAGATDCGTCAAPASAGATTCGGGTPAGGSPGTAPADRRAPKLSRLRIVNRARGPLLTGRIDEPARVTVTVRRRGARRALKTVTVRIRRAGAVRVALPKRLKRGRHAVTVRARDAAGNRSRLARLTLLRR